MKNIVLYVKYITISVYSLFQGLILDTNVIYNIDKLIIF